LSELRHVRSLRVCPAFLSTRNTAQLTWSLGTSASSGIIVRSTAPLLLHHNPHAHLIALGMTRYWLAADGLSLDVAPFVAALEHAIGRQALVFGKPAAPFFRAAAEQLALPVGQVLMIGDDFEADIGGAQAAGMKAALVRTGKFRPSDLDRSVRPDAVLDSIASLPNWWPR
jgi:phospholysine phosphohistidine inorganic pyrophosphate phosphatase